MLTGGVLRIWDSSEALRGLDEGIAQGRDDEDDRHERRQLGKDAACAGAAEHGGAAASPEDDAHPLLARLQEDENDKENANNDVKR